MSTTPLRQWGFWQCLPFSWTTLRVKHYRHPIGSCRHVRVKFSSHRTEVRFASFLPGAFTTMAVINPPKGNWQNAPLCTVGQSNQECKETPEYNAKNSILILLQDFFSAASCKKDIILASMANQYLALLILSQL